TVFEARRMPGGILTWGIPGYRLPNSVARSEIAYLKKLGVKFRTGRKLGAELDHDALKKKGFEAVFLGVGLSRAKTIGLPGEKLKGVCTADDFLFEAKTSGGDRKKMKIKAGRNVAVIGGGNVAMDAACTAKRLGAERVDLVCLESYEEMPAFRSEIEFAQQSGIEFHTRCKPLRISGNKKGRVRSLKGIRIKWKKPGLLVPSNAVEIPGSEFSLPADTVVQAVGMAPDPEIAKAFPGLKFAGPGLIAASKKTGKTNVKGVFAGGDIVNGGDTVVQALAEGRLAAEGIDAYLSR
ncbi:MAG: FAD-dependent oxidoreductase, partial [Spirochaetota bacterium]|nr:FAD-dependent oxidoreductase [Spirochaetota bacterium]